MNSIIYKPNTEIIFSVDFPENAFLLLITFEGSQEIPELKFGEINWVNFENKKIINIYAGNHEKFSAEPARKIGGLVATFLLKHQIKIIQFVDETFNAFDDEWKIAFFEGLFIGNFNFDMYKEINKENIITCVLSNSLMYVKDEIDKAQKIAFAVNLAKTIGQLPANIINPVSLAELVKDISESFNLNFTCLGENELEAMGAHGIFSVGKGSQSQPRMIILEHKGNDPSDKTPIALVGKAITFDTGGYSLKSVENIKDMKFDKLGGMTVLGTLVAAALLEIPQRIVGIICAAENMISDHAYRPDDIIRTLSGKTVEIITTDAEGRLVLADGITYAKNQYSPKTIIDFATLTGGIVTALGTVRAGLFSNNESLANALFSAGELTGEKLWQMPLDDEYFEFIKGDDADLKNSGGRLGHPIMGGIFLKQFVNDQIPWAHIDIAGTASSAKQEFYKPKGANGFGIRLMIKYLHNLI
jgi:leucyl aminopeptidase